MLASAVSSPCKAKKLTKKQLEDHADYQAAVAASRRLASGETEARPIEELWRKLGLDN